ncbi:hypothetical protein A2U01_0104917, partial [Trifolium medium]|nr:hypothetical protein [Trifolium medium]
MAFLHVGRGHPEAISYYYRPSQMDPGAVDYFTKWVEAEPIPTISADQ